MKMNRLTALALALLLALLPCLPGLAEESPIWRLGDTGDRVAEIQARLNGK